MSVSNEQLTALKQALTTLEKMQARLSEVEHRQHEPIAIIGMGCRFPGGVHTPESFWQLLRQGVDTVREIPADRWKSEEYYDPDPSAPGKISTRQGAFLEDIEGFDPTFFGMTPREAVNVDPQQRLLLEVAWEALEDAGQVKEQLSESETGVFIGIMSKDYAKYIEQNDHLADINSYYCTGNDFSFAAGRLAYTLGLQGPSMAIDTACSSSLVAVHLACQSLRTGECDMAVAGGVSLMLTPHLNVFLSKVGAMSPDGRCKTFSAEADGMRRGEGCGVVVLKRLSMAQAHHDRILAVIRGSAVNHDGPGGGLTVPNGLAQQKVIRRALTNARVAPQHVGYVEAHGTGTPLGDPIEVEALGAVYSEGRTQRDPLVIGSVKTNIGHLDPAAGIAGLIKTVLVLRNKYIPAHLHAQALNPLIPWQNLPIVVPAEPVAWLADGRPRTAALSSFGMSGTNAHAIVQEFAEKQPQQAERSSSSSSYYHLLTLSAHNEETLRAQAEAYSQWLKQDTSDLTELADICYTAAVRRTHHHHRLALTGRTRSEMADQLLAFLHGETYSGGINLRRGIASNRRSRKLAFVFSGQGSQWMGMGQQLLRQEARFREVVEECDKLFQRHAGWSILDELMANEEQSRIQRTDVAQPLIFTIEVALAELWRSWGIVPDVVVGHSIGEVAAACVAGILSLEDALKLVYHRGRLMQRLEGQGKMVLVSLSPTALAPMLEEYPDLSLAALNNPRATVVAGKEAFLTLLVEKLQQQEIICRCLPVNYAFHSAQVNPLLPELIQQLQSLHLQPAKYPMMSTVSGQYQDWQAFTPEYWASNMRKPVQFATAIEALIGDGYTTFLEIGPHPVLLKDIAVCLSQTGEALPSLIRGQDERVSLLSSLGALHCSGWPVNWSDLYPTGRQVSLPVYAWQRMPLWLPVQRGWSASLRSVESSSRIHPLLECQTVSPVGQDHEQSQPGTSTWSGLVSIASDSYLKDHGVQGVVVLSGAAYIEAVLTVAQHLYPEHRTRLEQVQFHKMLILGDNPVEARQHQLVLVEEPTEAPAEKHMSFRYSSCIPDTGEAPSWVLHATGRLCLESGVAASPEKAAISTIKARCTQVREGAEEYVRLDAQGVEYGPCYRGIKQLWMGKQEAIAQVHFPEALQESCLNGAGNYLVHPAFLDACLHTSLALVGGEKRNSENISEHNAALPVFIEHFRVHHLPGNRVWTHVQTVQASPMTTVVNIHVLDDDGRLLIEATGTHLQRLNGDIDDSLPLAHLNWLYEVQWVPQPPKKICEQEKNDTGNWYIFADHQGIGDELAALLKSQGEHPILIDSKVGARLISPLPILPGTSVEQDTDTGFSMAPGQPAELEALFAKLPGENCRGIIYLWSAESGLQDEITLESLELASILGCETVLYLVQQMAQTRWQGEPPHLWAVTRGTQAVEKETGLLAVAQSPLWGLGRGIAEEHTDLWGGLIDLDPQATSQEAAEQLWEHIRAEDREDLVAFRQQQRYVARLEHQQIKEQLHPPFRCSADASYLITGGTGGLGLRAARWLVEQGARHLILMSRTRFPSRNQWSNMLPEDRLYPVVETVYDLEEQGARIHLAAVDIADAESLTNFSTTYGKEGCPPIRGIIHAAGIGSDHLVMELNTEILRAEARAKIAGSWLLHQTFGHIALDFFVLFSSAATLLSPAFLSSYAAANSFLDALAHYRRSQGLTSLSVNWGIWSQVGMGARREQETQRSTPRGMESFTPEEALKILEYLIRHDIARSAVMPIHWQEWRQYHPASTTTPYLSRVIHDGAGETQDSSLAKGAVTPALFQKVPAADRLSFLTGYLHQRVAHVTRISPEQLDTQLSLQRIGLDSLMAIELKNSIGKDLAISLPVVKLLQGLNIIQLAQALLEQIDAEPDPFLEGLGQRC